MKEEITRALNWHKEGKKVAVATVIKTWGSAPCPVGARLVVDENGNFSGSVSGGCVEAEVIGTAHDVLESRQPRLLSFRVADETAWETGLACGGEIEVFVESLLTEHAKRLVAAQTAANKRINGALITRIADGAGCFVAANMTDTDTDSFPVSTALAMLASGEPPAKREINDDVFFIETLPPARRLLIIGATHIAQELLPLAAAVGFSGVVIDPRRAWATKERFPDIVLLCEWPDAALEKLKLDSGDAVVTLTHDPKIDDPALSSALRAKPKYIGALGSRRTHEKRLARLTAEGFDSSTLAFIHAPVGLAIGAKTAAEIALSVIAEIIGVFRKKTD